MTPAHDARIFLVDDSAGTRQSLRQLLEFEAGISVCGEAADVAHGLSGIKESHPDLAIVDMNLGAENGLQLLGELQNSGENIPVLVFSVYPESVYAQPSFQKGARGYVMKSEPADNVLTAVHQILDGHPYLSPAMQDQFRKRGIPYA